MTRLPCVRSAQAHPFHTLSNVILSPHTSGWSDQQLLRRFDIMAANLDALAEGRALRNVVYKGGP